MCGFFYSFHLDVEAGFYIENVTALELSDVRRFLTSKFCS